MPGCPANLGAPAESGSPSATSPPLPAAGQSLQLPTQCRQCRRRGRPETHNGKWLTVLGLNVPPAATPRRPLPWYSSCSSLCYRSIVRVSSTQPRLPARAGDARPGSSPRRTLVFRLSAWWFFRTRILALQVVDRLEQGGLKGVVPCFGMKVRPGHLQEGRTRKAGLTSCCRSRVTRAEPMAARSCSRLQLGLDQPLPEGAGVKATVSQYNVHNFSQLKFLVSIRATDAVVLRARSWPGL